jgi:alternate signal-mediated exported protein
MVTLIPPAADRRASRDAEEGNTRMNKLVKGAIAGAAGIVLLMGGAGSLAYWNDSANAGPASGQNLINAGTLTVVAVDSGSWVKGFYNASNVLVGSTSVVTPANLGAVRIVPGNKLTYTQTFNLNASGDDLYFTLATTNGAVTANSAAAADVALAAQATGTPVIGSVTGGNVVLTGVTAGVYKVNASAGPSTITVTWTINFPFGASAVNTAKDGVIKLTQGSIVVTQVAAP